MATMCIEHEGETIEVAVRRDGYAVVAETFDRVEVPLTPSDVEHAEYLIDEDDRDYLPSWMDGSEP